MLLVENRRRRLTVQLTFFVSNSSTVRFLNLVVCAIDDHPVRLPYTLRAGFGERWRDDLGARRARFVLRETVFVGASTKAASPSWTRSPRVTCSYDHLQGSLPSS